MAESTKRTVSKVGTVTSNKMDKSVVVRVERIVEDAMYKRYIRRSAKFMAHDENNDCRIGDTVEIEESRPLSARKRWRVRRILRRSVGAATTDPTADVVENV